MSEQTYQDILKEFGAHLASIRKQKKLSLRKLATNCNIDWSDIGKYERGEINISLKTIAELAKGLDVSYKELMDF
ncbi:helix-turn-helix domain-containing protein [Mucilaginibacter ginkgonis]|uniref:Helix-turn-helix transcriptional regulator n=1 Tax=Mucilaginibacter ginkgonis TaxID=2682091 RepID=A0A6I4HVY2_9SPHI|nr:helix-turn-helix transcriptional regulator [Mucilaginibacter ginkgonis]QQL50275.1 helix-turn-helix transcriptional regulator [Mucilaginibacter ginkgonis]